MTLADLIIGARNGSPRAADRLLSLVEGARRASCAAGRTYPNDGAYQRLRCTDPFVASRGHLGGLVAALAD